MGPQQDTYVRVGIDISNFQQFTGTVHFFIFDFIGGEALMEKNAKFFARAFKEQRIKIISLSCLHHKKTLCF